jgi:DHA2 family multidrug resistance protein
MFAMMVVGRLVGKIDLRLLLSVGFAITAFSLWQMTQYSPELAKSDIVWPGVIQGLGLGLVFVPLSAATFATLSPEMRAQGTAMYSLIRNIGSSIGISLVQTLLVRNTATAHASLTEKINITNQGFLDPIVQATYGLANNLGAATLNAEITRQAAMIGYLDDFRLMLVLTLAVIPLLLLIRPAKRETAPSIDHAAME